MTWTYVAYLCSGIGLSSANCVVIATIPDTAANCRRAQASIRQTAAERGDRLIGVPCMDGSGNPHAELARELKRIIEEERRAGR